MADVTGYWVFWYSRNDEQHPSRMDDQNAANTAYDTFISGAQRQSWVDAGFAVNQGIRDPDGNEVGRV